MLVPAGWRADGDLLTEHTSQTSTDAERGQVNTAAAEIYDAFFVPALFGQFPEVVLDHARLNPGARLLDVGCGTGILARVARRRLGPDSHISAIDPNEGMLAVARRSDTLIGWRSGIAESLPYSDESFEHTVSQFAAMFFTDRGQALGEMARVTNGGGTVTIATWSGLDRCPGYAAVVALIDDVFGREAAAALEAPFVLGEVELVRELLDPIGAGVRVDEVDGTARFASIADWVHTDVGGWTLSDMIDEDGEAALGKRAEQDLASFVTADGSVTSSAPALVATVVTEH